jgi:SAM-dependent methyltransferase
MAHIEQVNYCQSVKKKFPHFFSEKIVVDIGSLDINGNNRTLFDECLYLGVDVASGKNVDFVSLGSKFLLPDESVDVVISTECFEHDISYEETLKNIYRILKPGGLFVFTCATVGRAEHGTARTTPQDAPLLQEMGEWANYYKNLTEKDIREVFDLDRSFSSYEFSVNEISHDLYFYGFKTGSFVQRKDYSFTEAFKIYREQLVFEKSRASLLQEEVNKLLGESYELKLIKRSKSWRYTSFFRNLFALINRFFRK